MLSLLLLVLLLVLVLSIVGRLARARRSRAYGEEQRRLEESQRDGGEELVSPFAGFPFGGILEEMMRGMETRSYRIDPETGEWVDMTGEEPPEPAPESAPAEGEPLREKRKSRTRPKSTSSMSPFGMLGGMGMPPETSDALRVRRREHVIGSKSPAGVALGNAIAAMNGLGDDAEAEYQRALEELRRQADAVAVEITRAAERPSRAPGVSARPAARLA